MTNSAPNYAIKDITTLAALAKLSDMTGVSKAQILRTWAIRDYDAAMAGYVPSYARPTTNEGG